MYAVIMTGAKQYRVEKGAIIEVEKLPLEAGKTFSFDEVLLVSDGKDNIQVGQPFVAGAKVKATVLAQDKDKKVVIFKYKRKTGYRRKTGHRQPLTRLQIDEIAVK
ncbi:MAG: 50S ribosomal protein L21 [Candidatus Margulisiibacteriota bacterium]|jgi:large subunit ribosomal protein L21